MSRWPTQRFIQAAALMFLLVTGTQSVARADEPKTVELQPVVVTGSRIPRPDFESASPILTVSREAFESTGSSTVEATLNLYPQFVPAITSTSNNPGYIGQAQLSLRGLSPQATLVLLDGRRLIPANGIGVVDVNMIPPAFIERVEIITGGASSVYGSDAVAGVVNVLLTESFEGTELGGFYGQTDRGDGEQWDLSLTAGTLFAGGRGSAYGSIGRSERRLVTHGDRDFSAYVLQYVGAGNGSLGPGDAFVAGGSPTIEDGAASLSGTNPIAIEAFDELFARYGYAPGTVPFQQALGFNQDGTLFTLGNFSPGSVANFRGEQDPLLPADRAIRSNFAPWNALQLPLERSSAFGRLQYDLSDAARLHGNALYAEYDVTQQAAPTPLGDAMPRDNPFVPEDLAFLLDSRPSAEADFNWSRRMSEVGPRIRRSQYRTHQVTLGVDRDVLRDWRFEAYLQQGEARGTLRESGNVLLSRVRELSYAPDGGAAACGGFDVFGRGSTSGECARYISADGTHKARLRRYNAEASLEGPLLELPAGDLRMAIGAFHMRDEYTFRADPAYAVVLPDGRLDIVGFIGFDDVHAEERNTDLYLETLIPLLAGQPGAHALEAGLGYRRAEYDQAGGADAWKAELLFRPIEALRLRGSLQRAVRAPALFELFRPQLPSDVFVGTAGDPCNATSAARTGPDAADVEALCLAQGVPPELLDGFRASSNFVAGFTGGNPGLEPEEAETWTLGVAWSPAWAHSRLGRLQAAIDWYRIEVKDTITTLPFFRVLAHCFDPAVNPGLSPEQTWCTFFARDPLTGEIVDARQIERNIAALETRGIDLQLDWRLELGPGTLGANLLVSWLDSFERSDGAGAPMEELAGTISGSPNAALPEWKGLLSLGYDWRGVAINARTRYIHRASAAGLREFTIPSRSYLDLYASYGFARRLDGLRLGIGIENVTDRDPPVIPGGVANTDPQQYDVLGRRYFLRLDYRR